MVITEGGGGKHYLDSFSSESSLSKYTPPLISYNMPSSFSKAVYSLPKTPSFSKEKF